MNGNLSEEQKQMLYFLRDANQGNPLDLATAFDLHNPAKRETTYREYLEIAQNGLVQSNRQGAWITQAGEQALAS